MLGPFESSSRQQILQLALLLAPFGLLACHAEVGEPLLEPVLPCELDGYRWQMVGEEPSNCSASEWLLTPTNDGGVGVEEHGCASLKGLAFRVDDDIQMEVSGGGFDVQLLIHTSTGQCERIPVSYMHRADSKLAGAGDTLEFVRLGPR